MDLLKAPRRRFYGLATAAGCPGLVGFVSIKGDRISGLYNLYTVLVNLGDFWGENNPQISTFP